MYKIATCAAIAFLAISTSAPANALPQTVPAATNQSLVQKTYYRQLHRGYWHRGWRGPGIGLYVGPRYGYGYRYGYCGRWRNICASRWGWGGPGYGRCLWRHGC
jgi:hypothetical protein